MKKPRSRVRKPHYLRVIYQAACEWHWFSARKDDDTPEMKKLFRALQAYERADSKAKAKAKRGKRE